MATPGASLPDLAEGLLGFHPDVALALEDVIAQYLLLVGEERPVGGGLAWGSGEGQHHRKERLARQIVSRAFGTSESQSDAENAEPSPPKQRVTCMPREGQDQVYSPAGHSPSLPACGAGWCPAMWPLVSLPRLPGSGHPLPGPVGAAPGCPLQQPQSGPGP